MSGMMMQHIAVWVVVAGCVGLVGYRGISSLVKTVRKGVCGCSSCPASKGSGAIPTGVGESANKHNPHTADGEATGRPQRQEPRKEFFIPSENLGLGLRRAKENVDK
jgi:hypothetical protein